MADEWEQGDTISCWIGKKTENNIHKLGWEQRTQADIVNDALELAVAFKQVQEQKESEVHKLREQINDITEVYRLETY